MLLKMGLQNQLSDASSESIVVLMAVLMAKTVSYIRSLLFGILHSLGLLSPDRFHHQDCHQLNDSQHEVVGSGLAGVILLCDQLNLNRIRSYPYQSDDGVDPLSSYCVVCLNRMGDGDRVRMLQCGHVFHTDCFDGWLRQLSFNCPLCRAPLVSDEHLDLTQRRIAGDLLAFSMTHLHGRC